MSVVKVHLLEYRQFLLQVLAHFFLKLLHQTTLLELCLRLLFFLEKNMEVVVIIMEQKEQLFEKYFAVVIMVGLLVQVVD